MACPRCELGLSSAAPAGVRVDACGRCDGVFVDGDALLAALASPDVVDALRASLPRPRAGIADGGRVYVKCPQCTTLMNRTQYAHGAKVVIDYCRRHGVWFDGGELPTVLDFLAAGGAERAQAWEDEQAKIAARDRAFTLTLATARSRWEVARVGHRKEVVGFFRDLFR